MQKRVCSGLLFLGIFITFANVSFADVIVKCSAPKKPRCRCLIEYSGTLNPVYRKNKVIINDRSGRWIKTGQVERVRGNYVIAKFRGRCNIGLGYQAKVFPYDLRKAGSYEPAFE